MASVELASAYINIIPTTQGAQGTITELFSGEAQSAGEATGETMGNSLLGGMDLALIAGAAAVVASVGAIAAEAWQTINEVAEYGDTIDKQSQMMSISARSYQELSFAAERSGTSISSFQRGIRNITNDLADMANGVSGASENYDRLGVSLYDAEGNLKSTEDVLYDSIYALADMEDVTQRNALANDIFGRSYTELLPLLNSGSDGIGELFDRVNELNGVMSDEGVSASAGFEDAMTNFNTAVQGVKNSLAENGLLDKFAEWIDMAANWVASDHPLLEAAFGALVSVCETVGETIGDISYIVSTVYDEISPIISEMTSDFDELTSSIVNSLNESVNGLGDVVLTMTEELTSFANPLTGLISKIKIIVAFAKGDYDVIAQELGIGQSNQTQATAQQVSQAYQSAIANGNTGFGSAMGSMGTGSNGAAYTTYATWNSTNRLMNSIGH